VIAVELEPKRTDARGSFTSQPFTWRSNAFEAQFGTLFETETSFYGSFPMFLASGPSHPTFKFAAGPLHAALESGPPQPAIAITTVPKLCFLRVGGCSYSYLFPFLDTRVILRITDKIDLDTHTFSFFELVITRITGKFKLETGNLIFYLTRISTSPPFTSVHHCFVRTPLGRRCLARLE